MSASITEAHRKLAYELMQMDDRLSAFAHRTAAQLIANSEARAVAAAVTALTFTHHQLRAQNDQFSENLSAVGAAYNAEKARAERAEAELDGIRALADRRNERDHSQDTTHQLVAALDQALDIAQAELAQFRELDAERARMRQIAVDKRIRTPTPRTDEEAGSLIDAEEVVPADFSRELERELAAERARLDWLMAGGVCMVQHTGGFHVSRLHAPVSRAAIDAAMKEETK